MKNRKRSSNAHEDMELLQPVQPCMSGVNPSVSMFLGPREPSRAPKTSVVLEFDNILQSFSEQAFFASATHAKIFFEDCCAPSGPSLIGVAELISTINVLMCSKFISMGYNRYEVCEV